ncbi:MAG: phosphate regulon transcriptional regulator PhoB [Rhodospirillales bacterium]
MSLSNPKILIIEDEPSQIELIHYNLKTEGYEVFTSHDGEDGLMQASEVLPDLILLDWMIPKISGMEVCRRLRRNSLTREIPVIMVTARSEEVDKIQGLDMGADDYITKPYSIKELLARVRAAIRRPASAIVEDKVQRGNIVINLKKHIVYIDDKEIVLGPTEYKLLLELMKSSGRVLSREQLLDNVWGVSADVDTRTVDVHIGRLRKSIKKVTDDKVIKTVRSFGYSLIDKS